MWFASTICAMLFVLRVTFNYYLICLVTTGFLVLSSCLIHCFLSNLVFLCISLVNFSTFWASRKLWRFVMRKMWFIETSSPKICCLIMRYAKKSFMTFFFLFCPFSFIKEPVLFLSLDWLCKCVFFKWIIFLVCCSSFQTYRPWLLIVDFVGKFFSGMNCTILTWQV